MIFNSRTICNSLEISKSILIETSISDKGIPVFEISGLISKSIEESKKRIITAFSSSAIQFPLKNICVNLSPAEINKEGTYFDLSIAATILQYTHSISVAPSDVFIGELSFDGSIRGVSSLVFLVLIAQELGFKRIFVPGEQSSELQFIKEVEIFPVSNLKDLLNIHEIRPIKPSNLVSESYSPEGTRFNQILGNERGKKVLGYCLAGRHNLLFEGFPGTGKSLLAKASTDLLPQLGIAEALSMLKVYSYLGLSRKECELFCPPFRSPHNSSSYSAIFGTTGNKVYPGELALSHNGVLFLDEFPEFNRLVIEGLRSPLEDKYVSVSRGKGKITFPCDFILIATQNPCKCGYFNHPKVECRCSPQEISRYRNRISGPILDRIDVQLSFNSDISNVLGKEHKHCSYVEYEKLRTRVLDVRNYLSNLNSAHKSLSNPQSDLSNSYIQDRLRNEVTVLVSNAQEKYSISNRKIFKVLNLSFTISLFKNKEDISAEDFFEALNLANLAR